MKRWHIVVLVTLLCLGISVVIGYRMGVRLLQAKVMDALGAGSNIAELRVNWFSLEVLGLSIEAPNNWPAARTLQAERVRIVPNLLSLLTKQIHISSIVVERPYLSVLRIPGKLIMVPSLTERTTKTGAKRDGSSDREVTISKIELQDGSLDLFDSTVSRPPLKTRFEQIHAEIRDVTVPWTAARILFDLTAIVKGATRDGRAEISGWVGPGKKKDSSSQIILDEADLVSLQPYLIRRNEARITRGTLDLKLDTEIRDSKLDGKGKVVIRDLEFAPSRGLFDTFMGMPRSAVISFLENHENAIDTDFTLKGDTSKPSFSLNEAIGTRIAAALAGQLGVSIKSVAEGLGELGRKGVEGAGSVAEGVGSALRDLFGGNKK
jgi:hypothetical protein